MRNHGSLLFACAVVFCAFASAAAVMAQTQPEPAKAVPAGLMALATAEIQFFLAHGEANACGPGCHEWIAAEGKIDLAAAQRLRRLLAKLGRRRPPIYFHSPGGITMGGIELGRLIREQKLEASVGYTVPVDCDRDQPLAASCETRKRSGQELESAIDPTVAMCNSACVLAVAGGIVRTIPPYVKLGIHDVELDTSSKLSPGSQLMLIHKRIQEYLHDMGFDNALFAAIVAVPNESPRFLERDELYRLGIDRRELVETAWQLVDGPRPSVLKRFFVRADGAQPRYLYGAAKLACGAGRSISLALAQQHFASEPASTVPSSISINLSGRRIGLPYQIPSRDYEIRLASLAADTFDAIGDDATMAIFGIDPDRTDVSAAAATLNMVGFSAAYAKLRKSCEEAADAIAAVPRTKPVATPSVALATSPLPVDPGKVVWPSPPGAPVQPAPETDRAAADSSSPSGAEPRPSSCSLQLADAPQHMAGRVTGFVPSEQALASTRAMEARLGAKISPAYLALRRVAVDAYSQVGHSATMAALPENMNVRVGDLVEIYSNHRDPSVPCEFVPSTVVGLIDHGG